MTYEPDGFSHFAGLLVFAGLFGLLSLWVWLSLKWQERQWQKQLEELLKAEQEPIERKAEAVSEILLELELPQLAERKKRLEISRQLCIALFVR